MPVLKPKTMSVVTSGISLLNGLGHTFLPEEMVAASEGKILTNTEKCLSEVTGNQCVVLAAFLWALSRGESLSTSSTMAAVFQIAFILRFMISKDYSNLKQPKELLLLWCGVLSLWAWVAYNNGAGLVDGDMFLKASAFVYFVLTALPDLLIPKTCLEFYGLSQITPRTLALVRNSGAVKACMFTFAFFYRTSPAAGMAAIWSILLLNLFHGLANQDFVLHGTTTTPFFWWSVVMSYMLYSSVVNMQ